MRPLKVKCPAKLNLFLDISFRMPNGYHILEMVMQTVNLFDTLHLSLNDTGKIRLIMENSDIPADEHNIAYRCARSLLDEVGGGCGAEIRVHKAIPSQAGLGGGSADGAGVLVGLNHLLDDPLDTARLCELGAAIGADIPFCIVGGPRWYGALARSLSPSAHYLTAICSLPSLRWGWIRPNVSAGTML